MIAAMMVAALTASAQNEDLRNELSLSYGFGSASTIGDGIGEGFMRALFTDTENDNDFVLGPISAEYFRHFSAAHGSFIPKIPGFFIDAHNSHYAKEFYNGTVGTVINGCVSDTRRH